MNDPMVCCGMCTYFFSCVSYWYLLGRKGMKSKNMYLFKVHDATFFSFCLKLLHWIRISRTVDEEFLYPKYIHCKSERLSWVFTKDWFQRFLINVPKSFTKVPIISLFSVFLEPKFERISIGWWFTTKICLMSNFFKNATN